MSNPMVHAFFVGRALASAVSEQAERVMTDTLSNLGKFDAEQRDVLRRFADDVIARAQHEQAVAQSPTTGTTDGPAPDLQATIDALRAEIAQVRTVLQQYRVSP
jgi:polyhydroxyalkanoate synthesis regulator phasin